MTELSVREIVERLNAAALGAVDPAVAVRAALQLDAVAGLLTVGETTLRLEAYDRLFVLGAGKAGAAMAQAAEAVLGGLEAWRGGLVIVKDPPPVPGPATIELVQAGHPLPDARGVEAAQRIGALARAAGPADLVLVLISGGGSALLADPAPPLTLAAVQAVTDALLRAGATIGELNTVRKHLAALKGGRLAQRAAPATVIALILSDVVGSPLDVIASGPTVPDPTTYADALAVLAHYDLTATLPAAVRDYLGAGVAGELPDTPNPDDPLFARVITQLIGDNRHAALAAVATAADLGTACAAAHDLPGGGGPCGGRPAGGTRERDQDQRPPVATPSLLGAGRRNHCDGARYGPGGGATANWRWARRWRWTAGDPRSRSPRLLLTAVMEPAPLPARWRTARPLHGQWLTA